MMVNASGVPGSSRKNGRDYEVGFIQVGNSAVPHSLIMLSKEGVILPIAPALCRKSIKTSVAPFALSGKHLLRIGKGIL